MRRADALAAIHPKLAGCAVVTIMGAVAAEMQEIGHRDNFFYLQHGMGLASSMGLGIALAQPKLPVIVLDGDGSILMNLGALTTLARYKPKNLVHIIFDNESFLSAGGSPTATATGADLAAIARGAGVKHVFTANTVDEFASMFDDARARAEFTVIIAKIDMSRPAQFVTDLTLLENRFQFERWLSQISKNNCDAGSKP